MKYLISLLLLIFLTSPLSAQEQVSNLRITKPSSSGSGITIGTTTIANGTDKACLFQDGTVVGEDVTGCSYDKTSDIQTLKNLALDETGGGMFLGPTVTSVYTSNPGPGFFPIIDVFQRGWTYRAANGSFPFQISANTVEFTSDGSGVVYNRSRGGTTDYATVPLALGLGRLSQGNEANGCCPGLAAWQQGVPGLNKTTSFTVDLTYSNGTTTNSGASGSITASLPATPVAGVATAAFFITTFCRVANFAYIIDPDGTDTVSYGGTTGPAGDPVTLSTAGCATFFSPTAGVWIVKDFTSVITP